MKTCKRCGTDKPVTEFYAHPAMADGFLSFCKACVCARVRGEYAANPEKHKAREHARQQSAHRKAWKKAFYSSPEQIAKKVEYTRKWRAAHADKYRAHLAVGNALRDGKILRLPCEVCGATKTEAHHDDYSRPLEVRWLCKIHHMIHHGRIQAA
jgi:rubrerythrin